MLAHFLEGAWVEVRPQQPAVLVLHSACHYHLLPQQSSLALPSPRTSAEPAESSVLDLDKGIYLHWLPTYNMDAFVHAVLPKLLAVEERLGEGYKLILSSFIHPVTMQYLYTFGVTASNIQLVRVHEQVCDRFQFPHTRTLTH